MGDIRHHIGDNRKKYVFSILLFVVVLILGLRRGITIINPYDGLYQYNPSHFRMLTMMGSDNFVVRQVLGNLFVLLLLYLCSLHYFVTPLSVVVLIHRVYHFGITIALLFRLFGFGAFLVVLLALIPFFVILYGLFVGFAIYLYLTAQRCYRYEISSCAIFETKNTWRRILGYVLVTILVTIIGGGLTVFFGSSSL